MGRGGFLVWSLRATPVACLLFACGDDTSGMSGPGASGSGGAAGVGASSSGGSAGVTSSGGTTSGGSGGSAGERDDAGAGGDVAGAGGDGAGAGSAGSSSGGVGGTDGGAGGDDSGGSAGRPITDTGTCATPEDATRWNAGRILYVDDDDASCDGHTPCFPFIVNALAAATSGDTIVVLPGTHFGADIAQDTDLPSLRITSLEGPDVTVISGSCMRVMGWQHGSGQIWIDGFTFRDCGGSGSLVNQGWGVYVSTFFDAEVRIQDNVFEGDFGRGPIGLWSSTAGTRFHAVIARNRISGHHGEESALDIELPADAGEDYCVRVENNVIIDSDNALNIFYTRFRDGEGKFEVANNTLYGNALAVAFSGPSGVYTFVNNILFGNTGDFSVREETGTPYDFRNNLIGSGQFTGLHGNFAADPLFMDADAGDFRLRGASPAADRGDVRQTAVDDLVGTRRTDPPDLGAYERTTPSAERLEGLRCGDRIVQRGSVQTSQGAFLGFETCDDGNTRSGDGCSSLCQFEPAAAPHGRIGLQGAHLCVLRPNGNLQCWNGGTETLPTGPFEQLALSAYQGCALRTDGTVSCWRVSSPGTPFTPTGTFTELDGDYYGTCGLRENGSITCWDRDAITVEQSGLFTRVDTNQRVCGLTATGMATCFPPYTTDVPSGPFVHLFPERNSGFCGLRPTGELACVPDSFAFLSDVPLAGLVQVNVEQDRACGLRPDGRALYWDLSGAQVLLQDRVFTEVAPGFDYCCGITTDGRAWCSQNTHGLPAE